ncbi:MAG: TrkH family potassium uptake protein [Proteobacteria bacterium]|nr:TrkH family potassium uptake protein [Pseudomonadota bacterium]MBU4297956.1 TrkH family potassium uptake protein [Pseudomonadota bacterium]MCG2749205.1 TrkH family potassium uptake protein [Desulfobulbaceae bacterium]
MREKQYLKTRYAAMLASVGVILMLSGAVMLTPLLALAFYPQETAHTLAFALPAGCQLLSGLIMWKCFRSPSAITLSVQEGGIIVLVGWLAVILFSAWPFAAVLGMPFSQGVFEAVSGWTTTGLSVVDVGQAGPMILLWRSIMQLAGGAGLAIIMMSAIVGPTGVGIPSAEGRGDQLVPQVRRSARLVLVIYTCYAAAGTIAYRLAGMSLFDALNHAFAAVSTGGFSTRPESIGFWDSTAVEAVTLPLMLLGNLSFVTAWLLCRGKFGAAVKNGEIRLQAILLPLSAAAVFIFTSRALYPQLGKSLRVALFETVSALTTTGFSTVTYGNWNAFGILVLIVLMLIGGGTCSTAGGIKQFRIYLLAKLLYWDIQHSLLPKAAILERPVWEGNRQVFVDDARVRQVAVFVFLYLTLYVFGVMLLCTCGFSLTDSLFEFASALGTVGLSVGVTAAGMPDMALWAETLAMFLGRLEFLVVVISLLKFGRDMRVVLARSPQRNLRR